MITVAFDHQIFSLQRVGGVSRQFCELIDGLRLTPDVRPVLPFWFANALYTEGSPAFRRQHRWSALGLRPSRSWVRDLNEAINRRAQRLVLARARFDILQPTYYDAYFLDALAGRPFVLAVVDMIPELFPDLFAASPHLDKARLIPEAAAILTNSATTRRDLLRFHPEVADRVFVAPLGAPNPRPPTTPAPPLPETFVLFVGKRGAYKNFARLGTAVAGLMRRRAELHLVCVGGGQLKADEAAPFRAAGVEDRVHALKLDDDGLQWVYRRARLFVYPSLYEGFGIPIVEAFAFGCPTALASIDVFHEVADEAAVFFDPADAEAMTAAIARLLDDEALRQRLIRDGRLRVRDFSWAGMVERTAEVYRWVRARGR